MDYEHSMWGGENNKNEEREELITRSRPVRVTHKTTLSCDTYGDRRVGATGALSGINGICWRAPLWKNTPSPPSATSPSRTDSQPWTTINHIEYVHEDRTTVTGRGAGEGIYAYSMQACTSILQLAQRGALGVSLLPPFLHLAVNESSDCS